MEAAMPSSLDDGAVVSAMAATEIAVTRTPTRTEETG